MKTFINPRLIQLEIEEQLASQQSVESATRANIRESSEVNSSFLKNETDSIKADSDLLATCQLHQRAVARGSELMLALARVRNGKFSDCDDCESDIDPRRLLIHPSASRCIRCQSHHERVARRQEAA